MPRFVPDPDNAALNLRGRRVWGVAHSSLVLEMPSTLCHGRVCACTAQEQHRPLQGADILGCTSWHTETSPQLLRSVKVEEIDEGKTVTGTMFEAHRDQRDQFL